MSYRNTVNLLPKELIAQVQEYVDGKVIYIPKKASSKKGWGESTDTKQVLALRNSQICLAFQSGKSVEQLSGEYFLSEKSIQRILKQRSV